MHRFTRAACFVVGLLAVALTTPQAARAEDAEGRDEPAPSWSWVARPEAGLAIWSERDRFFRAFEIGAHIGGVRGTAELLGTASFNLWRSPEIDGQTEFVGVFNVGLAAGQRFFGGRARTLWAFGASVLFEDTAVDDSPGSVGLFIDGRALGIRFTRPRVTVGVDPIAGKLIVPALDGIPLVELQYMTMVYVELPR